MSQKGNNCENLCNLFFKINFCMYKNGTFIDNNFKITGIRIRLKNKRQAWYLTLYKVKSHWAI